MSREVMQQALDALAPFRGDGLIIVNEAIEALQAALAQPEPEPAKPLTDEQIVSIRKECYGGRFGKQPSTQWGDSLRFARAIEAAHGIRPAPEVRRARPDDTEGGEA